MKQRRKLDLFPLHSATEEEKAELVRMQGGRCAICNRVLVEKHLDHDHVTGLTRAVLCRGCNHMLGNAQDDPDRLEAGAAYLRKMKARGEARDAALGTTMWDRYEPPKPPRARLPKTASLSSLPTPRAANTEGEMSEETPI